MTNRHINAATGLCLVVCVSNELKLLNNIRLNVKSKTIGSQMQDSLAFGEIIVYHQ
jgi:hypothetical protein